MLRASNLRPERPATEAFRGISAADVQDLRDLYDRGLCLQAYQKSKVFGPFQDWTETEARVMAGRLAANLGSVRLGRQLHFRAYRHDHSCAEAQYYYALAVFEARGPLVVWNLLKRWGVLPEAPPRARSDLFALRARAAGALRDFETAEQWLEKAEQLGPDRAWHCIERAHLLEGEDRYPEALAAARRSLELHPYSWYRPGVQAIAHLLQLLDRDQEALDTLKQANEQIENGPLLLQMAALQVELGHYHEARLTYEKFVEAAPLLDDDTRKWLDVQRCRTSYFCGDFAQSAEFAKAAGDDFHNQFAERLAAPSPDTRRVQLPVNFVRQHYKTCAPATIAAIGRFWQMRANHLALAEAICYDGTPSHKQRGWAEENGWVVREFTLTWDAIHSGNRRNRQRSSSGRDRLRRHAPDVSLARPL